MPTFVHTQFACRLHTIYRLCAAVAAFYFFVAAGAQYYIYIIVPIPILRRAKYLYIILSLHNILIYSNGDVLSSELQ